MTFEGQTNWSPEQLEEWARPAAECSELVEIARTATSNNQAKNEALAWVTKIHEPLGQACRWLHILRAKYPERFEKLVSQTETQLKEEKEMEEKKVRIQFGIGLGEFDYLSAIRLCNQVLEGINTSNAIEDFRSLPLHTVGGHEQDRLRRLLIQILEEKFGLNVRICGNCKYFDNKVYYFSAQRGLCQNLEIWRTGELREVQYKNPCWGDSWAPKEVKEEKTKDRLPIIKDTELLKTTQKFIDDTRKE